MNDFAKKAVAAVIAFVGGYAISWGLVPEDIWNTIWTPEVVTGLATAVTVLVYGFIRVVTDWALGAFKSKPAADEDE